MGIIKSITYLNELTKDMTNNYCLCPNRFGTLYENDSTGNIQLDYTLLGFDKSGNIIGKTVRIP